MSFQFTFLPNLNRYADLISLNVLKIWQVRSDCAKNQSTRICEQNILRIKVNFLPKSGPKQFYFLARLSGFVDLKSYYDAKVNNYDGSQF